MAKFVWDPENKKLIPSRGNLRRFHRGWHVSIYLKYIIKKKKENK